jgi:hypothetical protein
LRIALSPIGIILLKMRRTISEIIILVSIVIDDPKGIADN